MVEQQIHQDQAKPEVGAKVLWTVPDAPSYGEASIQTRVSQKWRIHDIFYISLLEQDITRKGQVDEEVRQIEFEVGDDDSREYELEAIWDSAVYAWESELGHLSGLYYLLSWKRYPKEENT